MPPLRWKATLGDLGQLDGAAGLGRLDGGVGDLDGVEVVAPGREWRAVLGEGGQELGHAAAEGFGEPGALDGEGLLVEGIVFGGEGELGLGGDGGAVGAVEEPFVTAE